MLSSPGIQPENFQLETMRKVQLIERENVIEFYDEMKKQ